MRAGPALTTHAPSTTTFEEYVPDRTPGDSKLPEHLEGRSAAAALALAARMVSASPIATSRNDSRRGIRCVCRNPDTSMFFSLPLDAGPNGLAVQRSPSTHTAC